MENSFLLEEIKNEIEDKRKALNQLILVDADKEDILKFSIELDRLIDKYYSLKLNKKQSRWLENLHCFHTIIFIVRLPRADSKRIKCQLLRLR